MAGLFDDLLQDDAPAPARAGGGLFDDLLQDDTPPPAPRRRGGLRSEVQPYVAGQAPPVLEGEFAPPASAPASILDTKQPGYGGTPADLVEQSKSPAQRAAEVSALRAPSPVLKAAPEQGFAAKMLDRTLAKPLDNSLAGLALETAGDAARGTLQASEGLAGGLWSGIGALGRAAGSDTIEAFGMAAGKEARDARQALTNRNDPESLTQQVFASAVANLPMAGLGMASLPTMAVSAALDEYGQSRDKGVPHEAAAERATVMGLAEALGERLGLPIVQRILAGGAGKLTTKEFGRAVADMLVKEQVGEQATTAIQDLYDAYGEYGEKKGMTLAQYLADVANTAKVTLGQSLLTAGVGAGVRRLTRRPQEPVYDARQAMLDRGFLTGDTAAPSPPPGGPDGGADGQAQTRQAQEGLLSEMPAAPAAPVGRPTGSPGVPPGAPQAAGATQEAPTLLDRAGVTRVGPSTIAQADDYADFTADALAVERASGAPGAAAGTADRGVVQGDLLGERQSGAAELAADGAARRTDGAAGAEDVAVRTDTGGAALAVRPNKDGTALVTGDPDTIGALTGNVRLVPTSQGILVGKTRAKEVQAAVEAVSVPEAFGSQVAAMKFAVQNDLAKTTKPVEAEAGSWVLQPVERPRTVVELTEERRGFDRLVPAIQGRLRGSGGIDLVPDAEVSSTYGAPVGQFVSAIRAAFSVPVSVVRDSGANGVYFEGRVYLDAGRLSSQGDFLQRVLGVTGHEVEHFYQESQDPADQQTNQVLEQTIRQYLRPGALEQRAAAERKGLKGEVTDRYVFNEVAADLNGSMWLDSKFWGQLYDADKGSTARRVFFRFMQAATKLMGVLRGTTLDADRWVTNVEKVREAFVQAWAERNGRQRAPGAQQQQQPTQVVAAATPEPPSAPAAKLDEPATSQALQVRQNRDGTLTVSGDVDTIRRQLPDDIKGRLVDGGLLFTHGQAGRVRAILEGKTSAYSRGGHVLARKPMTKDGRYVGAPPRFDTPAKVPTLRRWLKKLALEGEPGRFWYENSSEAVLRYVGGDVTEARKFAALLAIYSPQAKVDTNSTFALRAWAQYKAGQPIDVKTKVMDRKAEAAMSDTEGFWKDWTGEKTGNFVTNLMSRIDPTLAQGATVDMWMMRAAFYNHDAPTTTEYAFMEDETNRLADELGWEPQQVQAAIWVAVKARMEDKGVKKRTEAKSEKKGFMRRDEKGARVVPKETEAQHRGVWFDEAFKHEPTKANTEAAKFDFGDGLRRHIGQVSWEARPGRSTGVLPGVNDAPYEEQVEFQQAVQKALLGPNGEDLLAQQLGLLVGGDVLAPGVWQSEVAAGMQKPVVAAPGKGDEGKSVDPAQKSALGAYAAALGLLLRQEGVGWHRPFYKGRKADENGVELRVGRPFTPEEARALWGALDERMRGAGVEAWENGAGMISSPEGMRVVNFGALPDNGAFRKLVKESAGAGQLPAVEAFDFATDGDLVTNDWTEAPDGQGYRQRISDAGRPDLLGGLRDVLAPRVQAVFDQYSTARGWGNPGNLSALFDALERGDDANAPRASLTEEDPYARFDGVQVDQQVLVAETGETATLRLDAGTALRSLNDRRQLLQRLLGCLG